MFTIYILQSKKDNSYYVGMTSNIQKRITYHNNGKVKSTKSKIPWKIVYNETAINREDARKREKYLKSAAGRKFRKNLFQNTGD